MLDSEIGPLDIGCAQPGVWGCGKGPVPEARFPGRAVSGDYMGKP